MQKDKTRSPEFGFRVFVELLFLRLTSTNEQQPFRCSCRTSVDASGFHPVNIGTACHFLPRSIHSIPFDQTASRWIRHRSSSSPYLASQHVIYLEGDQRLLGHGVEDSR